MAESQRQRGMRRIDLRHTFPQPYQLPQLRSGIFIAEIPRQQSRMIPQGLHCKADHFFRTVRLVQPPAHRPLTRQLIFQGKNQFQPGSFDCIQRFPNRIHGTFSVSTELHAETVVLKNRVETCPPDSPQVLHRLKTAEDPDRHERNSSHKHSVRFIESGPGLLSLPDKQSLFRRCMAPVPRGIGKPHFQVQSARQQIFQHKAETTRFRLPA